MKLKLPERRRYIRIETPLKMELKAEGKAYKVISKNISPVGVRFEIGEKLGGSSRLDIDLTLPGSAEPIGIKGKVVWQAKTSLEDNAPYDTGVEIVEVANQDKNVFLKYICDTLYDSEEYRPRE